MKHFVRERICDCIKVEQELLENESLQEKIIDLAQVISKSLKNGGKIILCGNGGSASDAMHFAGEIVGRFQKERMAWPAIVLNADIATVTAIANDYGYDNVFARQMQGHAVSGDTFIGISTSGNSENVYRAVLETTALHHSHRRDWKYPGRGSASGKGWGENWRSGGVSPSDSVHDYCQNTGKSYTFDTYFV